MGRDCTLDDALCRPRRRTVRNLEACSSFYHDGRASRAVVAHVLADTMLPTTAKSRSSQPPSVQTAICQTDSYCTVDAIRTEVDKAYMQRFIVILHLMASSMCL